MRQKPIGEYIVDFFCSKLSLVIEVDGESHYKKERQDLKRQEYLESIGLTVLRFDNDQIKEGLDYVLQEIEDWIKKKETQPTRLKQG